MRNIFTHTARVLLFLAVLQSGEINAQTVVATGVPSGLVYYSDTDPGVIVFGVRNSNPFSITITDVASYCETGHTGTYTLWYHPTAVTGAPAQVTAANGWIQLSPSGSVNATSNGVIPVVTGISLVIPANTTYRLALQSPVHGPFYGIAGSTLDAYSNGGVTIYEQGNTNSPVYSGAFNAVPGNTPRSFYGSLTFRANGSAVANNAGVSSVVTPADFCPGSRNIQAKILNLGNNVINNVQVNWELDGVAQTPVSWSTPIDVSGSGTGNEALVTLGNVAFASAARNIRVWTSAPNGGADPVNTDDTVSVSVRSKMSGSYTIGGTGADFTTIQAAATALGNGICGPVSINITAGSGPYNEQVIFPVISGASATNTIVINGNNNTLNFSTANSNARAAIMLSGTDRLTIKKLNITASSGTTYGWGIHLYSGANNNKIDSCTIDLSAVTSTTQSNSGGIVGSGSLTSVTTDGNASNNVISYNNIKGGYQGIIINGAATGIQAVQNIIRKNRIENFYANGIELTDNDATVVDSNDISRRDRVDVTTFAGIEIGTGNKNVLVNANRIHDTHNSATTQSGSAYGIYFTAADAPEGGVNKVTNNLIYNFNSTTGTQYGIYNSSSDSVHYFHNTVVLNHAGSTSGTTRGFYQLTTATGIKFQNNIIYVARAGTGAKYCVYFGTSTSDIASDYNDLVMASTGGTTNSTGYYSGGHITLGDWQTANSGVYDRHSVSIDPVFTAPASGNYAPTAAALNDKGLNVGVTTDITGATRNATPDIGAYQFTAAMPVDLLHFKGEIAGEANLLEWTTASETNNRGFFLERSVDGKNFSAIAFIASKGLEGNSNALLGYAFVDGKPSGGSNFYRLRQQDRDGRISYSNTVLLSRNTNRVSMSAVYPNPVADELNLAIHSPLASKVNFIISDISGKILLNAPGQLAPGANRYSLNVRSLPAGSYVLKMVCAKGCETAVQTFVRQ